MRICICTTPIRPTPTDFPPFGSMAIIQSLRRISEKAEFYNIDYFRPSDDQMRAYFTAKQFDLVGISAVVSTAYSYTKHLARLIRSVSPHTIIVVGGNLAASAEILLRRCQIDFCVVGDGELIIQDLVNVLYEKPLDYNRLKSTKGLCFLDQEERFYFTGYGTPLPADAIEWPDYKILEADDSLPHFIPENRDSFYGTASNKVSKGVRLATVITTKGCVARCTFCHRWERGFRARPVSQIVEHLKNLKNEYNVSLIAISDENFGSDRQKARELAEELGANGLVWRASGVRARTVDPETLKFWKDNGCVIVLYGIESGSQKMLDVMEKNTKVQTNIDALRWTYEAGLATVPQFVLGMPGETDDTIRETIDFIKKITPYLFLDRRIPSALLSINYAQALPGTPLYEYARQHGFLGTSTDEEEKYLIQISDIDAYSTDHFINYTGLPLLKVLLWRHWINGEVDAHYLLEKTGTTLTLFQVGRYFVTQFVQWLVRNRFGMKRPSFLALLGGKAKPDAIEDYVISGYLNVKPSHFTPLFMNPLTRRWFYPIVAFATAITSADSPMQAFRLIFEHLRWSVLGYFRPGLKRPDKSLRKLVSLKAGQVADENGAENSDLMIPLRLGR